MKQVYFYLIFEKDHLGYTTNISKSISYTSLEEAIKKLKADRKRSDEGFDDINYSPVITGWEEA